MERGRRRETEIGSREEMPRGLSSNAALSFEGGGGDTTVEYLLRDVREPAGGCVAQTNLLSMPPAEAGCRRPRHQF